VRQPAQRRAAGRAAARLPNAPPGPAAGEPCGAPALRPLAQTALPASLDGRHGLNRADRARCQIAADDDLAALACFLAEYDRSPGTSRIYQRECERLLLWAVHECGKPLSSLTRQDFEGYLNFLADPQPAARWCGPKLRRESPQWRPFVGPLSEPALLTAIAAVNSLMAYLVDAGYLAGNPLGLIRQRRRKLAMEPLEGAGPAAAAPLTDAAPTVERFLDADMWAAVTAAVEDLPRATPSQADEYERLRFICALLYLLAPRAGELESHRMNSFREERGLWWWHVTGKGGKKAKVPVPDDMIQALVRYRKHLGLPAMPRRNDETPLLVGLRDRAPITARRLNQLLKRLFALAADRLGPQLEYKAEKLRSASAHWGRHTGITAKVDAGMEERYVQRDARHADRRTTQRYIHEEERRWHEEAQKQRLPWPQATKSC
jgi:integrase